MKQNHFIFSYVGNKRTEVEKLYSTLNDEHLNEIKYICEPYCGSWAFSYYVSTKHPGKYTYILNDNDKILMDIYTLLQSKEKTKKLEEDLNIFSNSIFDKIESTDDANEKKQIYVDAYKNNKDVDIIIHTIFFKKCWSFRPGLYCIKRIKRPSYINICNVPICKFLQNEKVILSCVQASTIIDKYIDNKETLIFFDPPYIICDNSFYDRKKGLNLYEYFINKSINNYLSKILICLENNIFVESFFKKHGDIIKIKKYDK